MSQRLTPRIVPPSPITVAVTGESGPVLAYGVVSDISGNGACIRAETPLEVGATLRFRISIADPPEIHEIVGRVAWQRSALPERGRRTNPLCGVMWFKASRECRLRLRELAERARPPARREQLRFERPWRTAS